MRSLRIRNASTAPKEEAPLDVWLEPDSGSRVNLWVGKEGNTQCVARLQLGNFKGDVHLRLPRLSPLSRDLLGISVEPGGSYGAAPHIAINKE